MKHAAAVAPLMWALLAGAPGTSPAGASTDWENPVFHDEDAAVQAATVALAISPDGGQDPRALFAHFVTSAADRPGDPRFRKVDRQVVESFLVTFPSYLEEDPRARRTFDAFLAEVEDERAGLGQTLERFGFPELPGLTYLKLVDNVDELQVGGPSSERDSRIAGVTYYCRYVVIPLSYISARGLADLQNRAAVDPSIDVHRALREWERESFRTMIGTFRHELVHVWTNSSLGTPRYRDRKLYPTWFLEGAATFLAGDPHSGLSTSYQGYQNLFFYLVERHGVGSLEDFFRRIVDGATVRESLEATYGIASRSELRNLQERWMQRQDTTASALSIALLVILVAAFTFRQVPILGSFQLWLAAVLGYSTFSGFCQNAQALNGATAVLAMQAVLGAGALVFVTRGARSLRRSARRA